MENSGWIYLRVDEGRAYCFGKTDNPDRRDSEYRKENPWIKKVYDFFVEDMHAIEAELAERTKHLRILRNSKEWIAICEESKVIVDGVRQQYALMTYAEWQQLRAQSDAVGRLATEQEQERQRHQLQAEIHRLVAQVEALRQEAAVARQVRATAAPVDHQVIESRMPLLNRTCPTCRIPLTYNAALTGYRCRKCNNRWT